MHSNTQLVGVDPAAAMRPARRFNPWPMIVGTAFAAGLVGGLFAYAFGG